MDFDQFVARAALEDLAAWGESSYYATAEETAYVDAFWERGTDFRALFERLDLESTMEFAAGHGRNTARMLIESNPGAVVVADPVPDNVVRCRERFAADPRVRVIQQQSFGFPDVQDTSLTSVFCYDSMVHFDPLVVVSYLFESVRVLRPGGRALLHHSNFGANPGGPYGTNPHARHFAPGGLIDHVLARMGCTVLARQMVDWGHVRQLDRLTLFEVPGAP